ncbi:MAG TPA: fimbrial protein [Buttiauxella sp.]
MKIAKITTSLGMTLGLAMGAHAADQGHGQVNFHGFIIEAPCSIVFESISQSVDLGLVATVSLQKSGESTPVPFSLKLEHCVLDAENGSSLASVSFTGDASTNSDLLKIVGEGQGAGIAIAKDGNDIKLGTASVGQEMVNGDNVLNFTARLIGDSDNVTPGEYTAIANFAMSYE